MKPTSNLFPWKRTCLLLCIYLLQIDAQAQCYDHLSMRTYDTVLTGPGYGTYNLSFPKFSPDSGLLVSVRVRALVTVQYGFTLKNVDVLSSTYGIWVGREDLITSPAMSAPYDNLLEQKIGSFPLNPGDQTSMPSFAFLNNYNNTDSITGATAPFMGAGKVAFTYAPITYTNVRANNNASFNYHATASETTRFSVSYTFCPMNVILSHALSAFTVALKTPSSVQLDWTMTGDERNRNYEIQRSSNGSDFTSLITLPGDAQNGTYTYTDIPPAEGKWYYRLQIASPGASTFSPIKEVDMKGAANGRLLLYPNPAVNHINLLLPGGNDHPSDWGVDIRTSDGRLVQQANFFHTNNFFLNFRQSLSPGVYFVRAAELQGRGLFVSSFRVN